MSRPAYWYTTWPTVGTFPACVIHTTEAAAHLHALRTSRDLQVEVAVKEGPPRD